MRDAFLVVLLFGVFFWLGGLSPLGAEGMTDSDVEQAYWVAWDVSDSLEQWSNFLIDDMAEWQPDEAEWNRVFRSVTLLIELLCQEQVAHGAGCLHPGY